MQFQVNSTTDNRYVGIIFERENIFNAGDIFEYEELSFIIEKVIKFDDKTYKLFSVNYQIIISIV
jgi:hypothetical protein